MTSRTRNEDALAAMRATNPVSATELRRTLADAELSRAMQRAIAVGESPAQPLPAGNRERTGRSDRGGVFARHRGASLGLGVACAVVVAALVLLSGGSVDSVRNGAHPSFAAAAVEVAAANPRLLVTAPGWSLVQARSFEVERGDLAYRADEHPPYGPGARGLSLSWYPARLYRDRLRENRHACCHVTALATSTLLGQKATNFAFPGQHPNYATVLSPQGNVFIEISGSFGGREEYEAVLRSLRPVGIEAWLAAMPAEVVRPEDRSAAIAQMLRGIPVPPGFDPSALRFSAPQGSGALEGESTLTDRFMLSKAVTGAVACGWLQHWLSATRTGDDVAAREAVEAMGTARHWPALLWMVREKGYRGSTLPPHGQGWPSEVLTAAREIAGGHLRRKPAARALYADGHPVGYSVPAGAAPASVMGCL